MSSGRQSTLTASAEDEIELLMPVHTARTGAARTVVGNLTAFNAIDFDTAAGMRTAVGETCDTLVGLALPDSTLRCSFRSVDGNVRVRVQARVSAGPEGARTDQVITVELSTSSTGGEAYR